MSRVDEPRGRDPGLSDARVAATAAFDQIAVHGPFQVTVTTGQKPEVALRGPATMLDDTDLAVRDGKLMIGWQEGACWSRNGDQGVAIEISLPTLTEATIGDSGSIAIDRIEGERFTAMLFSSGEIAIRDLEVKTLDALQGGSGGLSIERLDAEAVEIKLSGSGGMRVKGRATTATIMVAGAGAFDSPDFVAADASIIVAGSGGLRATVTDRADIRSMGSGEISLTGGARCMVSNGGAGRVICG